MKGGIKSQILPSPFFISSAGFPNIMAITCLKKPTKRRAIKKITNIVKAGYFWIPADKIYILVKNIPNGGAPVIIKKEVRNKILVTGSVEITPRTFAILVELYFKNIFPADKNKVDLANAW